MYRGGMKRAADLTLAVAALIALSPLMAVIALGARLSSPGPAIFRQQRVGRNGKLFDFYKFRSMPVDTGDISSDRIGEIAIPPFGRFIRRTNLDELPQLLNIAKGDMAIVGPRPPLPSQTELIGLRADNGALALRPGLTGLAQVNSYDGMSVVEKARFDGDYATRLSAGLDISIIWRTFGYLLRPPPKY